MITIEAAMVRVRDAVQVGALGELSRFRQEFYRCLPARADALFELAEAVLCADGPVRSLVELSLVPEHRRGHGGLYGGINGGQIEVGRLRAVLARVRLPRMRRPQRNGCSATSTGADGARRR
jgi:DDE superfamily endonuclease